MNRRAFLQRFGIGIAAAATLASVPVSALEALSVPEAGQRCAIAYLRTRYNEFAQGDFRKHPTVMLVSQGLFNAYEGELLACERFVLNDRALDAQFPASPRLKFKGANVMVDARLRGWDVAVGA